MRALVGIVLFGSMAACASSSPPELAVVSIARAPASSASTTAAKAPPTIDEILADTAKDLFPKRAFLNARALRLERGGERFASTHPLHWPLELVVIDEDVTTLHVVTPGRSVRLAAYVDRSDLLRVARVLARVATSPETTNDASASARIAPGIALEEGASRGGARHVKTHVDEVFVEGWTTPDVIGQTFTHAPFARSTVNAVVLEGARVVSASGATIATFDRSEGDGSPEYRAGIEDLGDGPPGLRKIRYATPNVVVEGFVDGAAVHAASHGVPRLGRSHTERSPRRSDSLEVSIAAGSPIFTRDGARIGTVLAQEIGYMLPEAITKDGSLRDVELFVDPITTVRATLRAKDLGGLTSP